MKLILFVSMFTLSLSAFAVERDVEGSAYRTLTQMSDCGSWGYTIQLEQAKRNADSFANSYCRRVVGVSAVRITNFENRTVCSENRNKISEKVTASARFRCNLPQYNTPPDCGEGEFTCYTNWGNLPYCSAGGKCSEI